MINPLRIERRSAPFSSMNLIAFFQQELREICSVLPGDSRNQCFRHGNSLCPEPCPRGSRFKKQQRFQMLFVDKTLRLATKEVRSASGDSEPPNSRFHQ